MDVRGKVALVTGGASGIGLATAELLRDEGASVVLADLDEARGRAAADELGVDFVPLDVSDPDGWRRAVAAVRKRHGGLDIAHLNAGVTTLPPREEGGLGAFDIATLPLEAYRRVMGANVDGVALGARAVVPALRERGGGAIVATASVAGLIGFALDPIYTMTKHAVVGLVRGLAPALEPEGITLNAVCPGGVATRILGPDMGARARAAGFELMEASQIADAVATAIRSGKTGQLYVCQAGQPHRTYEYAPLP